MKNLLLSTFNRWIKLLDMKEIPVKLLKEETKITIGRLLKLKKNLKKKKDTDIFETD